MCVRDLCVVISDKQVVEFYDKRNELIWRGLTADIDANMFNEKIQWLIVEHTGCLEIFI